MAIVDKLLSLVAPHECLSCGKEGSLLCGWCLPEAFPPLPSRCYKCAKITKNSEVCKSCRRTSPLRHVWVRTEYAGVMKDLVAAYKFNHARAGARVAAEALADALPYLPGTIIMPVPTATTRVRQRGFDHADLLVKELAGRLNRVYIHALSRQGQSRQVGTKRAQRLKQMAGAFRASRPAEIYGAHVLLIDDVVTTGATLEAAARTLKKAGAKSVNAVVLAQKL